jgi:hypothetical protein
MQISARTVRTLSVDLFICVYVRNIMQTEVAISAAAELCDAMPGLENLKDATWIVELLEQR